MAEKKKKQKTDPRVEKLKKHRKKVRTKIASTWEAFKSFISKGSVLNLAVGVIIGGAFNAIVNALVSILMSICTWGVPGGLNGLVTVLPAATSAQAGVSGIGQTFSADPDVITEMVKIYAEIYNLDPDSASTRSELLGKYTLHGDAYYYNGSALIDWGSFINAVISFIIIALTLFVIVRVFTYLQQKRLALAEKAKEEYYQKHPEERPAPAAPEEPKPTQEELLAGILAELKKANEGREGSKEAESAAPQDPA